MDSADVLRIFSTPRAFEKVAAEKPTPKKKREATLDPGEQAALGFSMMASGLARALPIAGSLPLMAMGTANAPNWRSLSLRGVKRISDIKPSLDMVMAQKPMLPGTHAFSYPDTKKFLGMFDLHLRPLLGPGGPMLDTNEAKKLSEMQPIVDSFIDKYDLANKGYTMEFRRGPFTSFFRGAYHDPYRKKTVFPRVSKEIVLHELGHAADRSGKLGLAKAVTQGTIPSLLLNSFIPITYIAGDEIKRAIPGTVDDRVIEFTQQHGPAIATAAIAAQSLYPEAKASILALKNIKDFEGIEAARAAAKRLIPLFGTYVLSSLPVILGFAMAKKYFYEAHEKLEKKSGLGVSLSEAGKSAYDAGVQVLKGLVEVVRGPGTANTLIQGLNTMVTSPEFYAGAMLAGIPATAATYAIYAHPGGKHLREKYFERDLKRAKGDEHREHVEERIKRQRIEDVWREKNPGLYAGYVGLGSAIGAGILTKIFSDITEVI